MRKNNGLGFSLVELMIVVVIIGILATVTLPAYRSYVTKSKISEAYLLLDGLKKNAQMQYVQSEGGQRIFGSNTSNDSGMLTAVANGEKILHSTYNWQYDNGSIPDFVAIPTYFAAFVRAGGGGNVGNVPPVFGDAEDKLFTSDGGDGTTCTVNDSIGRNTYPSNYGITVTEDQSYHWFTSILVADFAAPGSTSCLILLQAGSNNGSGFYDRGVVQLH
jgi:prepilin-type N-terminal cleavage/methylation domain-containing protein